MLALRPLLSSDDLMPSTHPVISLHHDLVAIPSLSREERDAADFLEAYFRREGLDVERHGDNVVASIGSGDDVLLLNSHLDVVPPSSDHPFDPFTPTIYEGAVYGRGAVDAKASVACMVRALCDTAHGPALPDSARVMGAFTTCEELGGTENGLEETLPKLGRISAALVGEPTHMQPCVAQKGLLILKLTAKGRTAHAARAVEGENAIVKAMRDIAALERLAFDPEHPELGPVTCNVTVIDGGTARNVIPDACTFWLDIRSTPSWPHDALIAHIESAVESEVHVHSKRLIPVGTDPSERIVRAVLAADSTRTPFGSPTLSDWIHLKHIPTVKIGPGDSRLSHTSREHVRLDELESATAGYASIIRQYFST